MQATGASLMRRLSSAIHPQLPLDPRQTSQLLASLTSSFQRHLDQAHPVPQTSRSSAQPTAGSRERIPSPSSYRQTANHFDSIISHPSFGGLQHSPRSKASQPEQRAFAALRTAEQKLRYGNFSVFEAASLFRVIYAAAITLEPRADLSFASRFFALLKSNGADAVAQFFSVSGLASRWVNLMFHEQQHTEVLFLNQGSEIHPRLLSHYLAAVLTNHGFRHVVAEIQRLNTSVRASTIKFSAEACRKSMFLLAQTVLTNGAITRQIEPSRLRDALKDTVFMNVAPLQTDLFISISQLTAPSAPDATPLLTFINSLEHNEEQITYLTATPFRRRLLLQSTLKAADLLLQQEKHADAQYLLHFSEVVFAEELQLPNQGKQTHTQAVAARTQLSAVEEEAVLSRLDGLLTG